MRKFVGAAVVAAALSFMSWASLVPASAAPPVATVSPGYDARLAETKSTDISARRYHRYYRPHYRRYYRPYYRPSYRPYYRPYGYARPYYGYRPYYYRPYPYYGYGYGYGPRFYGPGFGFRF